MQKKLSKNQQKNLCRIYNLTYTVYIYKRLFKEAHINEALLHCEKNPPNFFFGIFLFGSWHATKSKLCMLHGRLFMELSSPDLIVFSSNGLFFRTLFESINIWIKIKIGFHVWKIFFWIRIEDNFVNELFWLFKIFQRPTNMFEKKNEPRTPS